MAEIPDTFMPIWVVRSTMAGSAGGPFSFEKYWRNNAGANLKYDINDTFSVRAGYKFFWNRNDGLFVGIEPTAVSNGNYQQFLSYGIGFDVTTQDSYALFDAKFQNRPSCAQNYRRLWRLSIFGDSTFWPAGLGTC